MMLQFLIVSLFVYLVGDGLGVFWQVLATAVIAYVAINGLYMALSPLNWARASWTAKGPYTYETMSALVEEGKGWQWRLAGWVMFGGGCVMVLLLVSFQLG